MHDKDNHIIQNCNRKKVICFVSPNCRKTIGLWDYSGAICFAP